MADKRKIIIGKIGETATAQYLMGQGLKIIDRNWRIKDGEIDLIAQDKSGKFHFIEVKTRTSNAFGHPLEAINRDKAYRMQRLALAWLALHQAFGRDYQIDVCAVELDNALRPSIDFRAGVL